MWTFARCSLPALSLALTACAALPEPGDLHLPALDEELDRLERRGMVGQVVIAGEEGIVYQRGLGHVTPSRNRPVTPETVFPLASLTKPFTASAVLALAEDGKLDLDDPLGRHLPALKPPWADIPVRSLLEHTSGFPAEIVNRAWDGDPQFEPVDRETFLARVMEFPPDHPPGEGFNYSNVGYGLLGAVIETVSGQTWEGFLRDRLLEPAGLEEIGVILPERRKEKLVVGRRAGQPWGTYLDQPRLEDGLGYHLRASGDLHAPAKAIVAWWEHLHQHTWLPPAAMETWLQPRVREPDGSHYGFGWQFRETPHGPVIGHTGGNRIFAVDFSWYRDRRLLIYTTTASAEFEADVLRDDLHRRLFRGR